MQNHAQKSAAENNLSIAIWFILGVSCGCAMYTSYVIQTTLDTLSSSQSMALIISDAGKNFVSDDGKLGVKLTDATNALINTCDVAYALSIGCLGIAGALMWKHFRDKV